jgi:hypothetical protein
MRIYLALAVVVMSFFGTQLRAQEQNPQEKFVCKDSVDPRCMSE